MAQRVPYIFCRYEINVEGEMLDDAGQMAFFQENQGQPQDMPPRGDRPPARALIMEPSQFESDGLAAISFYVGYQPGYRNIISYDATSQRRSVEVRADDHIKSAHLVVIPALGCMAVEDRSGENSITHRIAVTD